MSEKLIIKNFGPINHIELELKKFNVLIGEQATGKSTVAKVLAACRDFSYIIEPNSSLDAPFEDGLGAWGLREWLKRDSYIYYECNHYSFVANTRVQLYNSFDFDKNEELENEHITFNTKINSLSIEFSNLLLELEKIRPEYESVRQWIVPSSFIRQDVANVLDNPFYLPAERGLQSIFSLGKNSIQNISDSLFNQLAQLDQIARLFKKDTLIEPLDITYKNIDGKGFIKKNNEDEFYSLYNAATGYQSTIPVVLVAKYYSEIRKKSKTFIVEEPEINLFPSTQQKLVEYLVGSCNNNGHSILLTTHSPYTLTSLNNLMYAYHVGESKHGEVNAIINEHVWLNPDDISAYMLLPDGSCEDIFDREENLIKTEKIDGVSRMLNQKFDDLLTLEFSGNESN